MPIRLRCHNCGKKLQVDDAFAGSLCRCIQCGALSEVPATAGADESNRPSRPVGPGGKKTEPKRVGEGTSTSHVSLSPASHRPAGPKGKAEPTGQHPALQRPGRPTAPGGSSSEKLPALGREKHQESGPMRGPAVGKFADGRVIVAAASAEETKRKGILTLILLGVAVILIFVLTVVVMISQQNQKKERDKAIAAFNATATPAPGATAAAALTVAAPPGATAGAKPTQPLATQPKPTVPAAPTPAAPPTPTPAPTPKPTSPAAAVPAAGKANFLGMPLNPASVVYVVDTAKSMTQDRMDTVADLIGRSIASCPETGKVGLIVPDSAARDRLLWLERDQAANADVADRLKHKLLEAATGNTQMDQFMRAVDAALATKPATLVVVTAGTRDKNDLAKKRDLAVKAGTAIVVLNLETGEDGSFKALATDANHYSGKSQQDLLDWLMANPR